MRAKRVRLAGRVFGVFAGLAVFVVGFAQGVRYEVVPLENLYGPMEASFLNDWGVITGSHEANPPGITFLLDKQLTLLPRLPGSTSNWGLRINNNNAIVGRAIVGLDYHSVLWLDGKPIDLGMTYDESGGDSATDINDSLQISAVVDSRPAVWESGKISYLPLPAGSSFGNATGINNKGDVAGSIRLGDLHAGKWVDGIFHDLHPGNYDYSRGYLIADNGDVGGEVQRPGSHNAALWKADGQFIDLGSLDPGMPSYFEDLNSNGQVVGLSAIDGQFKGFLWEDGQMLSLTDFVPEGWDIAIAQSINSKGQILAGASFGSYSGSVLLNPVPEPNSFIVIALLLAALKITGQLQKQR